MKKNKEYIKQLEEAFKTGDDDILNGEIIVVFRSFVGEIKELAEVRKVKLESSFQSIITDQNTKWNNLRFKLKVKGFDCLKENAISVWAEKL